MVDRVLLAEDLVDLREAYNQSLEKAGFNVTAVEDGDELYSALKKNRFEVILSDSDMPLMNGHEACRKAISDKILNDRETLIIGMSGDSDNQKYWRGLAHIGCFYDKDYFFPEKIGKIVSQALRNFRQGGLWQEIMPVFTNSGF